MTETREIRLTELDVVRLERTLMEILRTSPGEPQGTAELETLLDSAAIVPSRDVAADVITMNSTVVLVCRPSGERSTLTLVYPKDADPDHGRVSVLSPLGRALIGAHVGEVVRVLVPGYGAREFALAELSFQPEASGRFDL